MSILHIVRLGKSMGPDSFQWWPATGNGLETKTQKVSSERDEKFLYFEGANTGTKLPIEVLEFSSLEVIKICQDVTLCKLL